jgi:hypothetical protein
MVEDRIAALEARAATLEARVRELEHPRTGWDPARPEAPPRGQTPMPKRLYRAEPVTGKGSDPSPARDLEELRAGGCSPGSAGSPCSRGWRSC